ncbi:MAG TPA: hemerythrin domain-containing protein [Chloroflexia bacterium]|nr:hemerythrin domain-containing protein [Chloroflexia bacterium]
MTTIPLNVASRVAPGAATKTLRHEHQAVCQVLTVAEKAALRLEQGKEVPVSLFENVLEFLKVFVDRCHHSKEEDLLFPLMASAGIPVENGPIGHMLQDHEQGRALIALMSRGLDLWKAGDSNGKQLLIEGTYGYSALLRAHIQKENQVLFVLADSIFQPAEQEELNERFEDIEVNKLGAGTHERLHGMIDELVAQTAEWPGGGPGPESETCSCKCSH